MQQIEIKEEFKQLIPPLTTEEYKQLENNCLEEGIREKILLWNNYIIDGHNRYKIAKQWNLEFQTESKSFNSEIDVRIWMLDNQFGKRNLSDAQRYLNRNEKRKLLKEQGKQTQGKRTDLLSTIDKKLKTEHNTQKIIADELGWSTGKVAMADVVFKKATPEVIEKVNKSEVSINAAYKEIKKEEKKEELAQIRIDIEKGVNNVDINNIPEKFDVIYADPPWRYDFSESSNRKIENHYTTMDNKDIANMKVPAKENCVLFMWATAPKLIEAIDVMKGWDFTYKTHAIWDKEKIGMGYWFRGQHELLMVGVKGKVAPPDASIRISSIIKEVRSKHSKKPNCVAEYIEIAFHNKSKIELFCREPRKGWYSYGNQI